MVGFGDEELAGFSRLVECEGGKGGLGYGVVERGGGGGPVVWESEEAARCCEDGVGEDGGGVGDGEGVGVEEEEGGEGGGEDGEDFGLVP